MSSVNTNPYAQRIANVLGQTMKATQASLPTVSFASPDGDGSLLMKATKYIIYLLIATLVILLILTIIHYTVYPIFNFGDNPNAFISIPTNEWKQDWNKKGTTYTDAAAIEKIQQTKYTIVFDTRVNNTIPSNDTKNKFILLYKTTAGGTAGSSNGIKPITNFNFLQQNTVPLGGDPCFFVVYDALASTLQAIVVVNDTTKSEMNFKSATVEITPKIPYRVGIVVSDNLLELYLNGKFATSTAYPGKALTGGNTDTLFSTPTLYNSNVEVRNLFTLNRIATSGEIRQLGGPAME